MKTEVLNIVGMTCAGCEASVRHALGALPGIENVAVLVRERQVRVLFDEAKIDVAAMSGALRSAGYDVMNAGAGSAGRAGCCCA